MPSTRRNSGSFVGSGFAIVIRQICAQTPTRKVNLGWVSFQTDGSISFGLNDRTFISPAFRGRHMLWNVYNRVRIHYEVQTDTGALEPITNPHFTFHPIACFHLKAQGAPADEDLFQGFADMSIMLMQQERMPWIRATSATITQLPTAGIRNRNIPVEELCISVPTENLSVRMALDLVRPGAVDRQNHMSSWSFVWQNFGLQIDLSFTYPQISTLSWFHFY